MSDANVERERARAILEAVKRDDSGPRFVGGNVQEYFAKDGFASVHLDGDTPDVTVQLPVLGGPLTSHQRVMVVLVGSGSFVLGPTGPNPWLTPTFQNSWTNFGSTYANASYYKDWGGWVHIRGLVARAGAPAITTIFTLPAGYRPDAQELFSMHDNSNAPARVDVLTDGQVQAVYYLDGTYVSLSGISFRAGQT